MRTPDFSAPIYLSQPEGARFARNGEPIRAGVPLPSGLATDTERLALLDDRGVSRPVQVTGLERWPDSSLRWVLLEFRADVADGSGAHYRLVSGPPASPVHSITMAERSGRLTADVGCGAVGFGRDEFALDLSRAGHRTREAARSRVRAVDATGRECPLTVEHLEVEQRGHLRSTVRLSGAVRAASPIQAVLRFECRVHVFAGLPVVQLELTVRNPNPAGHPGGQWFLGDAGSVFLRELSFDVDVCGTVLEQRCSREIGAVPESVGSPFELYQESSGGEHWHSRAHVNRHGEVPLRLRGYRMRSGDTELNGFRASPIVAIRTSEANVALAARRFWEEFPRAVSIAGNRLELGLWPRQFPDDHELQGGEQKTFRLAVAFDDDPVTSVPLAWYRSPLVAATDPEWYSAAQATSFLVPDSEDPHAPYLALVNAALDPEVGFAAKRERIDEYGWRHFGDLYADHEAAGHAGTDPVVSHYNNQYDAIYGFGLRFMKTGDVRWWLPMDELASHVIDIDVYHTTRDKAAYNGGLFWHTQHYTDAGTSTHRTYPRGAELGGGGPSAEHNYSTGLMLHYFLTGNVASREAAVGLARWVLSMDDGARSRFRWIDRGPTGLVSATGSASYHGPGRAPGNSITVLMNAHRLTGDRAFLEKAEELIRRCIHPADDIPARNLLDAERRWYYTVFLQALAEYLERKSELGERDRMFAYARASLLHYARWMMEHEYPYLEKPEILEYPNETWAAQDMRKCDVLDLASRHASDAERPRFLERADFFFRSSTTTLTGMTTRSLTRPLVLMLTHGYMHAWFRRNGLAERLPSTGAHYDFGKPIVFVPQRARAVRRAAILAGIAVSVAILGGFAMW